MSLIYRQLTVADIPEVRRVYNSRDNLLKVKKTKHLDLYYLNTLETYIRNNSTSVCFGCFDKEKLIAFNSISQWQHLPFWTAGLQFTDKGYSDIHSADFTSRMGQISIQYCEQRKLYTGYTVSTLSGASGRSILGNMMLKDSSVPEYYSTDIGARYMTSIEEIIPPFSFSSTLTFSNMLGILEGKIPVPIIIRKWTAKNQSRDFDISKSRIKTILSHDNINTL